MNLNKHSSSAATFTCGCAFALAMALAIVILGTGCGGGGEAEPGAAIATELPTAAVARVAAAPLMDAEGRHLPGLSEALPADRHVRTQQQRYATRQQAQALMQAMQGEALLLQVECCGPDSAERAVDIAFDFQAEHDYSRDVPVLVQGSDLRDAASVVDRLTTAGMNRVWLVTR